MISIDSAIENYRHHFSTISIKLQEAGFVLGGGYEYDHGYFDKELDEEENVHRYYLRIPAFAIDGDLDIPETTIQLGKPFVIKHEVLTSNDPRAAGGITTSLINQFSTPIPAEDQPIADHWVEQSKIILKQVERSLLQ